MADIHKDDVGLVIELDTKTDLTTGTTFQILWTKPDLTTGTWVAAVVGAPADGIIAYTTLTGDIDQAGTWCLHANVIYSAGVKEIMGDKVSFVVKDQCE